MTDHSAHPPPYPPPLAGEGREGARKGPLGLVAVIVGLGTLAAIYGVVGASRNVGEPACRSALDIARRLEPFAHGQVADVKVADEARKLPVLTVRDAARRPQRMRDGLACGPGRMAER